MEYKVYTDGSCNQKENKMALGYIIVTSKNFITQGACRVPGNNIAHAESMAVGVALEELEKLNILKKGDSIRVITDCESVITYYKSSLKIGRAKTKDPNMFKWFNIVKRINSNYKLSFSKINAHQKELTENTAADRLAKQALWHIPVIK